MSSFKFLIKFFLILARLDIFPSFLQYFLVKETKKPIFFFVIKFDKRQL